MSSHTLFKSIKLKIEIQIPMHFYPNEPLWNLSSHMDDIAPNVQLWRAWGELVIQIEYKEKKNPTKSYLGTY